MTHVVPNHSLIFWTVGGALQGVPVEYRRLEDVVLRVGAGRLETLATLEDGAGPTEGSEHLDPDRVLKTGFGVVAFGGLNQVSAGCFPRVGERYGRHPRRHLGTVVL